jgi:hypothetical protein
MWTAHAMLERFVEQRDAIDRSLEDMSASASIACIDLDSFLRCFFGIAYVVRGWASNQEPQVWQTDSGCSCCGSPVSGGRDSNRKTWLDSITLKSALL